MLVICGEVFAQRRAPRPPATSRASTAASTDATQTKNRRNDSDNKQKKAAAVTKRQREQAIAALLETADAARRIEDLDQRAGIQTLVADALWQADEAAARLLFRRAWETATASDEAEQEASKNEAGAPATDVFTDARDEVLLKVSARDSRLAELFLQQLVRDKTVDNGRNASETRTSNSSEAQPTGAEETSTLKRRTAWRALSASGQRRAALALHLIAQRESRRAAGIVAPVVDEGASAELVSFLLHLRPSAPVEADALFARLLRRTQADTSADANDVLLLSTYVVSRELLVVVDERGGLQFRPTAWQSVSDNDAQPDAPPSAVRRAFFNVSASILLRPQPTAGDAGARNVALYFAIGRLLPFFEREAAERVPELRARWASLGNELEAGRRERLASQSDVQRVTAKNPTDPLSSQLDALARESDPQRRDRMRVQIVRVAAQRRLWERARSVAAQIEDAAPRRDAHNLIAYHQIKNLARDFRDEAPVANDAPEDFERAAMFVRNLDVVPWVRALGFAQAAALASERGRHARAGELLDEASRLAETSGTDARVRVTSLGLVTLTAARIEAARAWQLLPALLQTINALEDYTGDSLAVASAEGEQAGASAAVEVEDEKEAELHSILDTFRLDELFATMGRLDFARALDEARTLRHDVPRARAIIATARVALARREMKRVGRETL
ncbi:MAG TPA: hypothetical protein VF666_03335 [Pyrinomonadaceae bacterium]|jgi:hypothetical protein